MSIHAAGVGQEVIHRDGVEQRVCGPAGWRLQSEDGLHQCAVLQQAPFDELVDGDRGDRLGDTADAKQRGGLNGFDRWLIPGETTRINEPSVLGDCNRTAADVVLLHNFTHHLVYGGQLWDVLTCDGPLLLGGRDGGHHHERDESGDGFLRLLHDEPPRLHQCGPSMRPPLDGNLRSL